MPDQEEKDTSVSGLEFLRSPAVMSFFDHLEELRSRLIKIVIVYIAACFLFYPKVDFFLAYLIRPVGKLVFTSPADAFMARFNITLLGGLIISIPFIFYHIWKFISVGLKQEEIKYAIIFAPVSLILFMAGCLFAYFVMVPMSLQFLLSFGSDAMVPMITVPNYIEFVGTWIIAFGVVFELPLVLLFLTKIGIASPAFLIQKRRYAIVLLLIISAILTPPDLMSMVLMAGPLLILYEIGIIVSKLVYKQRVYKHV